VIVIPQCRDHSPKHPTFIPRWTVSKWSGDADHPPAHCTRGWCPFTSNPCDPTPSRSDHCPTSSPPTPRTRCARSPICLTGVRIMPAYQSAPAASAYHCHPTLIPDPHPPVRPQSPATLNHIHPQTWRRGMSERPDDWPRNTASVPCLGRDHVTNPLQQREIQTVSNA
jgi:hypothetical protein